MDLPEQNETQPTFPKREPLVTRAMVTTFVAAVIAVAVELNVAISEGLQDAVLALVASIYVIVTVVWGRRAVSPAWKVDEARRTTGVHHESGTVV